VAIKRLFLSDRSALQTHQTDLRIWRFYSRLYFNTL